MLHGSCAIFSFSCSLLASAGNASARYLENSVQYTFVYRWEQYVSPIPIKYDITIDEQTLPISQIVQIRRRLRMMLCKTTNWMSPWSWTPCIHILEKTLHSPVSTLRNEVFLRARKGGSSFSSHTARFGWNKASTEFTSMHLLCPRHLFLEFGNLFFVIVGFRIWRTPKCNFRLIRYLFD